MKEITILILLAAFFECSTQKKELDNVFYPFNNCMRTLLNAPQSLDDQVAFVIRLGFNGYGGHSSDDYFERRAALDKVGLNMPEIYWGIFLKSDGTYSYDRKIEEIIIDSKNRDLVVTLFVVGEDYMNNKEKGDPILVKAIQELADYAVQYNVKVAIYPHINLYVEEIGHAVGLAKWADRDNAGVVFNLCHFLQKEGIEGWQVKVKNALPYIYMVSISGADGGDTQKLPMDRLIQPLGEGTFDTYPLVKFLKDSGYNGIFGLQCYMIKQDYDVALRKSIDTWNQYRVWYRTGK